MLPIEPAEVQNHKHDHPNWNSVEINIIARKRTEMNAADVTKKPETWQWI